MFPIHDHQLSSLEGCVVSRGGRRPLLGLAAVAEEASPWAALRAVNSELRNGPSFRCALECLDYLWDAVVAKGRGLTTNV